MTSLDEVTCDNNVRVIDFEIQEGKGNLRNHIVSLWEKWIDDVPESPVMVFDREGSGVSFFSELVSKGIPENPDEERHDFTLRHIYIWNKSSKRKTCGLAWTGDKEMSTEACARAILSRWGASENTFKHTQERHPLHYHPGFKLKKGEKQDIKNPLVTEMEGLIKGVKKGLAKWEMSSN